jgi:lipopolysaccharide transport system permease protein
MSNNRHLIVIEANRAERNYWTDLWRYRELFYILAWRDISVRYKQTVIGVAWAILRPLLTMLVFVVVFGKIAALPSEGIPYPVYVFAAMLPWTFFSTSFADAGNSLVGNAHLISKVYFPRLIIPTSATITAAVDFLVSFILLLAMLVMYRFPLSWTLLAIPPLLVLTALTSLGAGLFVSALNVRYRDIRHIIPFVSQLGLYISPVGFSTTLVPENYRIFYYLNPMVAVIDGFRWAVSGGRTAVEPVSIPVALISVSIMCAAGLIYFRRTERTFADVI